MQTCRIRLLFDSAGAECFCSAFGLVDLFRTDLKQPRCPEGHEYPLGDTIKWFEGQHLLTEIPKRQRQAVLIFRSVAGVDQPRHRIDTPSSRKAGTRQNEKPDVEHAVDLVAGQIEGEASRELAA